mmetsp:Transcript_16351/g.53234  ORF Transcript_16351/g.53234 Transcript_16351/m.53234 type:complete len:207 (+) Transcript_16351:38-658(+)
MAPWLSFVAPKRLACQRSCCLSFPAQAPRRLARGVLVAELVPEEAFEAAAEAVVQGISLFGGSILVLAAVLATVNLVSTVVNSAVEEACVAMFLPLDFDIGAGPATLTRVRLQLAQLVALGLGVLLISDILETLVETTSALGFDSLYKLAIIAAIRTGLSYFLGLETEEIYERSKADARLDGRDINFQASQQQLPPDSDTAGDFDE